MQFQTEQQNVLLLWYNAFCLTLLTLTMVAFVGTRASVAPKQVLEEFQKYRKAQQTKESFYKAKLETLEQMLERYAETNEPS